MFTLVTSYKEKYPVNSDVSSLVYKLVQKILKIIVIRQTWAIIVQEHAVIISKHVRAN